MKFYLSFLIAMIFSPAFSFAQTNCESARKEYLEKYPDVKNAGMDPWNHFTYYGKNEGRIWPSCNSSRDPRRKDIANVFWNGTYPLYSLTSDVQILPNNLGEYNFWGTTNENPSPKEYRLLKGKAETVYKFIDYKECVNFCNEVRKSKGMELIIEDLQSNTAPISTNEKNDDSNVLTKEDINILMGEEPLSNVTSGSPKNVDDLESMLANIENPLDKIDFLNKTISSIKSRSENLTKDETLVFAFAYYKKFELSIPRQFDNPNINYAEWDEMLSFLNVFEGVLSNDKKLRSWYLYWMICLRQKLEKQDLQYFKMVVNEFSRDNFTPGTQFYDQCANIVSNMSKNETQSQKTSSNNTKATEVQSAQAQICNYKFVIPTNLTYKYIDNREFCCYCNKKYALYVLNNLTERHEQAVYVTEKLYLHHLQTGADEAHRAADYKREAEFMVTNYPDHLMMATMSQGLYSLFGMNTQNLGSSVRKIRKYNVTSKFCSPECENKCEYNSSCGCN